MTFANTALLHRNVQFIYEQSLAEQELESFGVHEFHTDRQNPWRYGFNGQGNTERLLQRSAYFAAVNARESVYKQLILPNYQGGQYNITRSVNQYLTHWIYPYKGKFHPQMIRALLNILELGPGQVVLDPFIGSGTTGIECMLMGIDAIGVDISPLCILISRVKTAAWRRAEQISDLVARGWEPGEDDDPIVRDFFSLARMVTASDVAVRKRHEGASYNRNLSRMVKSVSDMATVRAKFGLNFGSVMLLNGDCRDLARGSLKDRSVDAIITSPPYSIALDYVKNDAHALSAMGYHLGELRQNFIGVRGRPKDRMVLYKEDMQQVFRGMARVLRPGAVAVVVIGDATIGREVTTTSEMKLWGQPYGLFFEREMPKIVYGLYSVITDEKILFFRKE